MIEVTNLVKKYGDHAAVDGLAFTVEKGKIVGFLGPNGAGKSTTMNMITGYIAPTEGSIKVNGMELEDEPEKVKKIIGYLPEIPPLYPDMRVREYLKFSAELKKVASSEREKMIAEIMKLTKITDVSERLIKHLSKGYKQRVGLANALMGYPEILILDEPTVGLDPMQIIEMRELIVDLSKKHTILLSSHIMQEISAVCDEVMIINNGRMIAYDTPANITKKIADNNGLHLIIKGSKEEVKGALRMIPGIKDVKYDERMESGMIGLTLFTLEGRDIREDVFFALCEAKLPLLEMGSNVATLEEAFVALTKGGSKQHGGREDKAAKKAAKKAARMEKLQEEIDAELEEETEVEVEEETDNGADAEDHDNEKEED